jgi:TRAP transporter TAXI family solute receptor
MQRIFAQALAIPAVALGIASAAAAQSIAIGTNEQGSLNYAIGVAVATTVYKASKVQVSPVGFGGSSVFMPRLNSGALELAPNNIVDVVFAFRGTGTFEGSRNPNIRVVGALVPFYVGLLVRDDGSIKSVKDFKAKPFPTEFTRQKMALYTTEAVLAMGGLTWKDIKPVPVATFGRSVEYLISGKVVAANAAPGSAIVREAHAKTPVTWVPVEPSAENQKALDRIIPGSTFATLEPSPRDPTIKQKTTMITFPYVLVSGKHVSDDVIYAVTKALYEGKKELVASHGIFNSFKPEGMAVPAAELEYHPGAIKFYKEKGMWPPKRM